MRFGRRDRTVRADAPTEVLDTTEVLDGPVAVVTGPPVASRYERVEEETGPPPGPPREPWNDVGWALLVLLVLVVAGIGAWWYFAHRGEGKRAVPAVTGMPVASAVNALQARGFKAQIASRAHPQRAGTVYGEIPTAGRRLAKGSTVQLLASTGPATTVVPNAVGLTEPVARDRLVAAGFQVTETRVFSQEKPGTVVAQSPAAGSRAGEGGTVRINVSKGTGVVIVPNVVGQSVGAAETRLAKAGLQPVVQLHVPSAQPSGTVVAQSPPGGQARRGSRVGLNVSTGAGAGATGATGVTGPTGPTGTG